MPPTLTWWVACNFLHVYSLWISWQGVQLSQALIFHMLKPVLHEYHKSKSDEVWFLGYGKPDKMFSHSVFSFLPFYPTNNPKNQKFERKKTWRYHHLHKCSKNYHMLYCSWDMACDRCNCCFSFWANCCLITSLTAQKIKIKANNRYHFTHL